MRFLSDDAIAHLRDITEKPDLTGTRYDLVRELIENPMIPGTFNGAAPLRHA